MLALEAVTDQHGNLKLLSPISLPKLRRVIITVLDEEPIDEAWRLSLSSQPMMIELAARGIDEAQAADLRARLATFQEEWDSPEMDIYNQTASKNQESA
jgi:DNA-binding GntR family transcriptional regulator